MAWLPEIRSEFYLITSTIEERPGVIQEIRMRNEDVSIQADRNALAITHPLEKLDITDLPLQKITLGSKEWLFYFEKARTHILYLYPANAGICEKILRILPNAELVHALDETAIRIRSSEFYTNHHLLSVLTEHLKVNENNEFFDGGKKYVLKAI